MNLPKKLENIPPLKKTKKVFSISNLIPSEYILDFHSGHMIDPFPLVVIRAMKYDNNGNPISWGIFSWDWLCMSKKSGIFEESPLPSSRTDKWFDEFRFKTPEDAMKCWEKFKKKTK